MLDALAPARRRLVLGVAAVGIVLLATAVVVAFTHHTPSVSPVAQDAQPPVLLVPGYGGSTRGLTVLAGDLRDSGRAVRLVALGDSRGDLHEQADRLDEAVRSVLADTGAHSVDLVGYSAGGVTVRVWIDDHSGDSIARRVVTLGSPHHGTQIAGIAADLAPDECPLACQQLAPDSTLLRDLNAGDETPAGPLWVSIWTEHDRTVVPPSSGALAGSLAFSVQSVCPRDRVSHQDLPSDPTVAAFVRLELGRDTPRLPGTSVCAA